MENNNGIPQTPAGYQGTQPTQPYAAAPTPAAPQAAPVRQPAPQQTAPQYAPQQTAPTAQPHYQATAQQQQPHYQQAYAPVPPATYSAPKQSGGKAKTFWLAFAGAACACVLAFAGISAFNALTGSKVATGSSTVLGSDSNTPVTVDNETQLAEAVSNKVLPSVVAIDVYTAQQDMYSQFFGGTSSSGTLTESSLGSGIVISKDGYLLTNYHVIEGADKLMATINGEEFEASVVGSDPSSDLAVLKVDATELTAIEIGKSSSLNVGEWVMTAGSPFGLEQSVATGIVSANSRTVSAGSSTSGSSAIYTNMIQTDAAINPGNSGGALVDADGKLVGVNTLIASGSGSYSGVGFAIPVDYAMNIAQQIIDGKTPTHAQLGVGTNTVTSQIAARYGLAVSQGAYVSVVYEGTGAAAAGLKEGDIITKVESTTITSASDLTAVIRSHNTGDTVTVEYNRDGTTETTTVTLGSDESTTSSSSSSSGSSQYGSQYGNSYGYSQNGYGSSSSSALDQAA